MKAKKSTTSASTLLGATKVGQTADSSAHAKRRRKNRSSKRVATKKETLNPQRNHDRVHEKHSHSNRGCAKNVDMRVDGDSHRGSYDTEDCSHRRHDQKSREPTTPDYSPIHPARLSFRGTMNTPSYFSLDDDNEWMRTSTRHCEWS